MDDPELIGTILSTVIASAAPNSTPQKRPGSQPEKTISPACDKCGSSGWKPRSDNRVERCIYALERIRKKRLSILEYQWPEYRNADFKTMKPRKRQQQACEVIKLGPRGSWYITGYFGSGKTFLMAAQYRDMVLDGWPCIICSARQLMEEIRKAETPHSQGITYGYGDPEVYQSPVLALINSPDNTGHLFIDDLEKAGARSEFRAEMLFHIFDTIKRRNMGLTVTSNLSMSKIGPHIGEAAFARIQRICREIEL